jgi:hypothetical protein
LLVAGRDNIATWQTPATLCRERDWSRSRLIERLQNGLPYRTIPPGYVIDWHDPLRVQRNLNVETGEVSFLVGRKLLTVGIEVLPPMDPEVPAPSADSPAAASASVTWARTAARRLKTDGKIPEGTLKAELARLLQDEAKKAVKAGQLSRALKASYLENQLDAWGIWPLSCLK